MIFDNIKNLIFDLGGVIINLDFTRTFEGFAKLSKLPVASIESHLNNTAFWNAHEVGSMSDAEFRDELRSRLNINASDNELDTIWNALLLDIPAERIALLKNLAKRYRIFLLSNTNGIHATRFNQILHASHGIADFARIFEEVYYSHVIKLRKPDPKVYQYVLENQRLNASETVFIDDNIQNIEAAKALSIHTIHITPPFTIIDLLANA